ncbi:MAG TPA: tetratricopeptide repeat protein [Pyrinomonadaceae bacterium]|nr:tetratricopeptide repeat protein [Pyrinomonadaceae bacterium]
MKKRRIIAIVIAFVLTIAATAMWSATTTEREGDPDVNAIEDSGSDAGTVKEQKKGGNKVVKVLAAPFKALGRLFGRGDDHKLRRTTEKDAEKFASVGVERVQDVHNPSPAKVNAMASAKEHLATGRSYLLEGRINEAITELSTAASLDRQLTEAHNLLGVAYDKKGLADQARDSYERAVKVEPEDAETLNNLGFSFYQNGNYRAAVDRLKRAVKLQPTNERILNNLGLALCRLGKFQDAFKHFARAAGPLTGSLNTARMLERFGREEDAIRYYEDARRLDPNSSFSLRRLADLYKRIGHLEQAEAARNALAGIPATVATAGQ